ncbi:glycosyltransferase family 77 protein [Gelidibacter japonicus]|uniref:putative nucleotide-diphospho-sugar transferase n=1 Tax=Gelidibacter japonicus TaxID=1962232 RepID=UPI00201FD76A|nr:putative nucleotide-diphospho-sugar transferase [Gelidibacter japonicus]MCL8006537.1 glycosyltransferase family 77 protein [Gelidibacter japonicus]
MTTCIISGRYPTTEFESYINHKLYADKYGYSYIHCNWPTKCENNYLNKIVYILNYIDNYDYIIWIDDDAFFLDFDRDIMDYAPKHDNFISLCKSPSHKELKTFFSSGQFIVKSNDLSRLFFETVLTIDLDAVKKWWPDNLGYYTNGDQDIMIYLLLEDENFKNKMDFYDYKDFNSRWENLYEIDIHKPLVLHFTGRGEIKRENYLKTRQRLNLHASLVANTILEEYGIRTKERYDFVDEKVKNKTIIERVINKIKRWLQG